MRRVTASLEQDRAHLRRDVPYAYQRPLPFKIVSPKNIPHEQVDIIYLKDDIEDASPSITANEHTIWLSQLQERASIILPQPSLNTWISSKQYAKTGMPGCRMSG